MRPSSSVEVFNPVGVASTEFWRLQNAEEIPKQINPMGQPGYLLIALANVLL